ncbi:T9SS type A sorting domain-containing protein [Rufibacter sediminis]|uniref:T9SS type A sorting domain-containing protein n=1 Tax=Rufibacter sediminis TaxID=2762756 RepID=A0ABR6VU60_9BACT|nr:T9SS type A sorting domain-containing protein [Rufibacter sediminis]MBC3540353.1 T9SS type A sorting domain-containing protein [Rufibacter sediminis]
MKPHLPLKQAKFLVLPVFVLLLFTFSAQATHLRAGEIYYKSDTTATRNPFKFFITLVTYSVAQNFEETEATLHFGDCTSQKAARKSRTLLPNAPMPTMANVYEFEHTYAGPGTYQLTYWGANRNAGVVNISSSVAQMFLVQSTLTVDPFIGTNRSPVFKFPPVDIAVRNQLFTHNSAAVDADGDSLSYKLVTPLTSNSESTCGTPLPNAAPGHRGLENFLGYADTGSPAGVSLNRNTGQLTWNSPGMLGEFIVTMVVEEWRDGRLIGKVMRDRQILVHETAIVTGVSEEVEQLVSAYPNPASSALMLKAPSFVLLRGTQAYNALGKPLALPSPVKSTDGWVFDVQNAPEGFYLLHLQTSHGKIVRKFVVKR